MRRFQIVFVDRPPIRTAHKIGKDSFVHSPLRRQDSLGVQMKSLRRLGVSPGPLASIRSDDRNLIHGRTNARMPVEVEMDVERLPHRFQQRRRFLDKRDADVVRAGRRLDSRFQVGIEI